MASPADLATIIDRYRDVLARLESATDEPARAEYQRMAEQLRRQWVELNGGDEHELHEVAMGG